jgi:hypothetical protein
VNKKLLFFLGAFVVTLGLLLWWIYSTVNDAVTQIAVVGLAKGTNPNWSSSPVGGISWPWNVILTQEANAVDTEAATILQDYFENAKDAAGDKIGPLEGESQILTSEWGTLKSIFSAEETGAS